MGRQRVIARRYQVNGYVKIFLDVRKENHYNMRRLVGWPSG